MPDKKISTLGEFSDRVHEIRESWGVEEHEELWFRGESQKHEKYLLRPKLYRPQNKLAENESAEPKIRSIATGGWDLFRQDLPRAGHYPLAETAGEGNPNCLNRSKCHTHGTDHDDSRGFQRHHKAKSAVVTVREGPGTRCSHIPISYSSLNVGNQLSRFTVCVLIRKYADANRLDLLSSSGSFWLSFIK